MVDYLKMKNALLSTTHIEGAFLNKDGFRNAT